MSADLDQLIADERKRVARKAPKPEQRERNRLSGQWLRNLERVWGYADLLADNELVWLARITTATQDTPARTSVNPWTGRRVVTRRPTSTDDATRLAALVHDLYQRDSQAEERLRHERRRKLAARMRGLGLKSPRGYGVSYGHRLGFWRPDDDGDHAGRAP
jgi:hypothetical protein